MTAFGGRLALRRLLPVVLAMLYGTVTLRAADRPVVVGYLPVWSNWPASVDAVDFTTVTHLNIAFVNPNADGVLELPSGLRRVVDVAHAHNAQVSLSLAGGIVDASRYARLLSTDSSAEAFAEAIVTVVDEYGLDGIDVDIEGGVLNGRDVTAAMYEAFVVDLAARLHRRERTLTAAVARWFGDHITARALEQFDLVHIMAYDSTGTWTGPGDHASYTFAMEGVAYWSGERGVPRERLTLGVPFYGYGWGSRAGAHTWRQLLRDYGTAAMEDRIGEGADMVSLNGPATIRRKAQYAKDSLAGIMIWELTQDSSGEASLLHHVGEVMRAPLATVGAVDGIDVVFGPNPVGEDVMVRHPLLRQATLVDGLGRTVRRGDANGGGIVRMDLRALPKGAYVLVVDIGGRMQVRLVTR